MPTCVWICLKLIRAFFTRFYYKTKTLAMTSYGKAEKYQACQRTYINWQKPARLRPLGSRGKKCKPLERGGKETEKPVHLPPPPWAPHHHHPPSKPWPSKRALSSCVPANLPEKRAPCNKLLISLDNLPQFQGLGISGSLNNCCLHLMQYTVSIR